MVKDVEQNPITHNVSILKGFLIGSLIIGSVANPFGFVIQFFLFIIGFIIFIDAIITFGRMAYIVTTIITGILSAIISYIFAIVGAGLPYTIFVFIIAIVFYIYRFQKHFKK